MIPFPVSLGAVDFYTLLIMYVIALVSGGVVLFFIDLIIEKTKDK
jgi:hypothetical protein